MTYSCLLFYISPLFWQNLVKRLTTILLNLGFQRQAVVKKKFMDLGGQSLRRGGGGILEKITRLLERLEGGSSVANRV